MFEIEIEVTKEDIDKGQPSMAMACPIYWALKRKFPYSSIYVGYFGYRIDSKTFKSSEEIRRFVQNFDEEKPVQPIKFKVENELQS